MRILLLLFLIIVGCSQTPTGYNYSSVCGTEDSPYYLSESQSDTTLYRLDFWWWREDSTTNVNQKAIVRSVELLNQKFAKARMQFEINEIYTPIDSTKYNKQRNYKWHAAQIDEWYWEKRDSVAYSLGILVYPRNVNIFPGAAVNIPSPFFCIQENFLTSSTIIHEAAHAWGGLFHTHQPDNTDGHSYYTGDMTCDIKFHPQLVSEHFINVSPHCNSIIRPEKELTDYEQEALVKNWMSYTLFQCRSSFTQDQIDRMRFISKNSPDIRRAEIK